MNTHFDTDFIMTIDGRGVVGEDFTVFHAGFSTELGILRAARILVDDWRASLMKPAMPICAADSQLAGDRGSVTTHQRTGFRRRS